MKRVIKLVSVLIILSLIIIGCTDSSNLSNGDSTSGREGIQLSGILTLGTLPGDSTSPFSTKRYGSSPQNQIVVLAIDVIGNSFATTTDSSGNFLFKKSTGLQSNTAYAMIFIDMSSLEIIATLTNNAGSAGMLTVPGDAEVSKILVNPDVKLASIVGVINSGADRVSLVLTAADSLDTNGDGQISQGEIINALVNTTKQGEIENITSVSAFTFLGQLDTWTIAVDLEDDAFEDSVCDWVAVADLPTECLDIDDDNDPEVAFLTDSAEMTLLTTARVEGPEGRMVNAAKLLELTFLNKPYVDDESIYANIIDTNLLWETGYASGAQADFNDGATLFGSGPGIANEYWTPNLDSVFGNPPSRSYSQRMGLLGWSEYQYVDAETNRLITGSKSKDSDAGTFEVKWSGSSLPLNMPLNTPFEFTETETDEEIDPATGNEILVVTETTSTVTVKLVIDNGNPALIQEGGGSSNILPVFQIRYDSFNEEEEEDESECSYIIARFGVEGDDPDENCDDVSDWQSSFVDVRFGRIDSAGNVIDSTPAVIKLNDSGEDGLPVDSNGELTSATINWLAYLQANANNFDYQFEALKVADGADFGAFTEFWAWVQPPAIGSALSPQPEPNINDNTQTIFKMGEAPGTITVKNLHYYSSDSGVQFYLDLRIFDPVNLEDESVLEDPLEIDVTVDTSAATSEETIIDISATFGSLPTSDSAVWINTWPSVENPDGNGNELYDTTQLTVWVLMDGDGDLDTDEDQYEFPVDRYKVTGAIIQ